MPRMAGLGFFVVLDKYLSISMSAEDATLAMLENRMPEGKEWKNCGMEKII